MKSFQPNSTQALHSRFKVMHHIPHKLPVFLWASPQWGILLSVNVLSFGSMEVDFFWNEKGFPKWLCWSLILSHSTPFRIGTFICIYKWNQDTAWHTRITYKIHLEYSLLLIQHRKKTWEEPSLFQRTLVYILHIMFLKCSDMLG